MAPALPPRLGDRPAAELPPGHGETDVPRGRRLPPPDGRGGAADVAARRRAARVGGHRHLRPGHPPDRRDLVGDERPLRLGARHAHLARRRPRRRRLAEHDPVREIPPRPPATPEGRADSTPSPLTRASGQASPRPPAGGSSRGRARPAGARAPRRRWAASRRRSRRASAAAEKTALLFQSRRRARRRRFFRRPLPGRRGMTQLMGERGEGGGLREGRGDGRGGPTERLVAVFASRRCPAARDVRFFGWRAGAGETFGEAWCGLGVPSTCVTGIN